VASTRTALAFRPHTGWAVVVAVSGGASPRVLHRARVDLCPDGVERFVYHDIDHRGLKQRAATTYVAKSETAINEEAGRVMQRIAAELAPRAVAIVAEVRPLPALEKILTAHPLWHAAEGELYRNALALAAEEQGLKVVETPPKRLRADATRALKLDEAAQDALLDGFKKELGPPWQKDHREATLAALVALSAR
jgi:hypothetical protein